MEAYLPCLYAFIACAAFCLVFNMRGKLIFFTSLGGAIGWFVYLLLSPLQNDIVQFFLATVVITLYSEIMARIHRVPVTGYLLIALLPMVPGGGIYYSMEYCIAGNTEMFLETGLHTLGIAGALALGILLVSSLVRLWHACGDRTEPHV
ncbi:threonine/serine exporter family protein [Clostridium sp. D33t1_170424_F3]|uniref:threonine/serine exporter family protein n=1 Tax=Clostridium sp. D33t1_170424_F3 TaxID=2787099 RepID=UPI0018AA0B68|nr:threonine/serine exporter family protein [Clostridium sp. D33t1_170424_F3]